MKKRVVFGLPLTPTRYLHQLKGSSFCVSYWTRKSLGRQLDQAIELVGEDQILLVDNGAYSAWRAETTMGEAYWNGFAIWADAILDRCPQAVVVIPDVIEGSEEQNDDLINDFICCPLALEGVKLPTSRCMVVWHMHESLDRLYGLIEAGFAYIAIGSSGDYAVPGTKHWHARISEALNGIRDFCNDSNGAYSRPWLHMMRAQSMAHIYGFDSSDSTNIAQNHHKHQATDGHVELMAERIVQRIRYSCDGVERDGLDCPSTIAKLEETGLQADQLSFDLVGAGDVCCTS